MYSIIYLDFSFIYILAHLYIQTLSFLFPFFCYILKKDEGESWLTISKTIERVANICILKNYMYRGYTFMTFKDSILIWETGNVKKDGHTYIYWHISISKLFPHFLPPFCYISNKDEREIGWLFQKLLKGLQIYVYSRNCPYLGYTYMNIPRFNISLRKKRTKFFLVFNHWGYFCCLKWEMSWKMDIEEEWEKCPFVELLQQLWIFSL